MPGDEFDPVDMEIGSRVREARGQARLTQRDLAAQIGVTFQQVQKYETGRSRMAVSMLCRIAEALDVPASTLVGGLLGEPREAEALEPRERELVIAYRALPSDAQRKALIDLVRTLGKVGPG